MISEMIEDISWDEKEGSAFQAQRLITHPDHQASRWQCSGIADRKIQSSLYFYKVWHISNEDFVTYIRQSVSAIHKKAQLKILTAIATGNH